MRSPSYMSIRQDRASLCETGTVSGGLLASFEHRAQRQVVAPGTALFAEDDVVDRVLVLASGWAMKSKSLIDGRRQILDFVLPGDVFGSLRSMRSSHAVEMLTAGEVLGIPVDRFVSMTADNPHLAIDVARQLEAGELRAYERIAAIGCRSAHLRVCRLLIELVHRQLPSDGPAQAVRLALPLRQIHIADALGLRIETVCRVLGRLARVGVAKLRAGELLVGDLHALRRESELESPPAAGEVVHLRGAIGMHAAHGTIMRLSGP